MRKTLMIIGIFIIMNSSLLISYSDSLSSTYIVDGEIIDQESELDELNEEADIKKIEVFNTKYNKYIDYSNGYSLNYLSDMWVNVEMSPIKTIIANESTQIEIYYDDFNNTVHWPLGYLNYSNLFLQDKENHTLQFKRNIYVNNYKVQIIGWKRKKIERVEDDKNYYISAEIITGKREVYTIFIKSNAPIENYMEMIRSFKIEPHKGKSILTKEFNPSKKNFNQETTEFYNKYFIENEELDWGIYYPGAPGEMMQLKELEEKLQYSFSVLVRYQTLDTQVSINELQGAYDNNRYVELTLQTMKMDEDNSGIIYSILDGEYDEYFREYAKELKNFGHPVLFRLNNEMNGDWCVYSSFHHSKDTELYIKMWRYVYDVFKENGVDNVIWVWNPHDVSYPDFKWNHYLNYYPGDEYVDIVGMTGYNTGTYYNGEIWRSFTEIYDQLYNEYSSIFNQPLMITEFGSNSVGGSKEEWIDEMFNNIGKYGGIKIAIWFNDIDKDSKGNSARIYGLDEREDYIKKFQNGLTNFKSKEKVAKDYN